MKIAGRGLRLNNWFSDRTKYCNSYIKLPKELNHSKKGLINIQNIDDNKCLKWCLVRFAIL